MMYPSRKIVKELIPYEEMTRLQKYAVDANCPVESFGYTKMPPWDSDQKPRKYVLLECDHPRRLPADHQGTHAVCRSCYLAEVLNAVQQ